LEKKYFALRAPVLEKRSDVLTGKVNVEIESIADQIPSGTEHPPSLIAL
jgi:hypothetical protein